MHVTDSSRRISVSSEDRKELAQIEESEKEKSGKNDIIELCSHPSEVLKEQKEATYEEVDEISEDVVNTKDSQVSCKCWYRQLI